jgi:hypothetical protein
MANEANDEPATPIAATPPRESDDAHFPSLPKEKATVNLDAWQLPPRDDQLSQQLAEWSQRDPHVRAMSVSSLTRTFLSSEHTDSL